MPEVSDLLTKALFKSAAAPADNAGMVAALKNEPPQQDVMPFGVGGPAEPSGSPAGFLGKVVSEPFHLLKRLMDSSANAVPGLRREDYTDNPKAPQPNQPMYDAAAETTLNLMGTGMSMAEKNAAGSFGGVLAKTANIDKLRQANRMLDKGQHPDIVRQLTGWEYGPDMKPRFEISNQRDRMMYPSASGPAGTLYQAPDIYKAYPQLQRLKMFSEINPNFPSNIGNWNLNHGVIDLSSKNAGQARLGAMHELQHAIQNIEDFTPGSSVQFWDALLKKHPEFMEKNAPGIKDPFALYDRTAGELEAKNVEARANFSDKERMMIHPRSTLENPTGPMHVLPPMSQHPEFAEVLKALRRQ